MHSIEERSGIDSDRLHLVCFYCLSRSADPADFVAACTGYYEGTKVRRYEGTKVKVTYSLDRTYVRDFENK